MPYPVALGATLLIELPIYAVALVVGLCVPWPRALIAATLVNVATHPAAWYALTRSGAGGSTRFVAVECGVWLVETLLLLAYLRRDAGRRRGPCPHGDTGLIALAALTANLASCLAGLGVALAGR